MSGNGTFPGNAGFRGPWWFLSGGSGFNAIGFLVRSILSERAHIALVRVVSVTGGGVAAPPVVAVQPMVSQADGFGNLVPHGIINGLPVLRSQGGTGAVIVDPVVGDLGVAAFADRDISNVVATGKIAGPGSSRQSDWSDGIYLFSVLGAVPKTFVRVTPTVVTVQDATGADLVLTDGTLTASAPTVVLADATVLQIHNLPTSRPGNPDQVWRDGSGDSTLFITAS